MPISDFNTFIENLVKGHLIGDGAKFKIIIQDYAKKVMTKLFILGVVRDPDTSSLEHKNKKLAASIFTKMSVAAVENNLEESGENSPGSDAG